MELEKSVERIVPKDFRTREEYLLWLRHQFAYETAASMIDSSSRILEIGFGEGYGADYLAGHVQSITALDILEDTVTHASAKYDRDNCQFMLYNGQEIPFPDHTFDAVVSFQVIEHIREDRPWVNELSRVLKNDGRAFITTPNRETRLKPGEEPWNEFHFREYRADELSNLFRDSFSTVCIFGVRGKSVVEQIERERVKRSLSIYKLLPDRLKALVTEDFKESYDTNDFYLDRHSVRDSMDLFAVAVK